MAKKPAYEELKQRIKELEKRVLEHRQTEKALLDREQRYRLYFENVSDVMFSIDPEFKVMNVSPSLERILGYRPEELIGQPFQNLGLLVPEYLESAYSDANRVLAGERIPSSVYEFVAKDGTRKFGEVSSSPFFQDGKVVAVICVARDVTDRKQAEEALRQGEESFRRIVEDTPALICRFLPDGTLTLVNNRYCGYFNRKREHLIGQNFFQFIPEEDRESVRRHFMSLNKQRSMITYQHRVIAPDGTIRWQQWTDRALLDEKGKVKEYQSVGVDITRRVRTEEALQRARDELESQVKERTRELEIKTRNLEEANTALKVLLKKRDEDKTELEEKVLLNVKQLIGPYLAKLKKSGLNERQNAYLDILESNLNHIISPFSRNLSLEYSNLTPTELQIANLIKEGKATKEIAETLDLSGRTIDTHRLKIRTKLGIRNKKANLRSYLLSLH